MDKKEVKEIIEQITKDNYIKWKCKKGKIITIFEPFGWSMINDNICILIFVNLIDLWGELLGNRYSEKELEYYMTEYIKINYNVGVKFNRTNFKVI